MQKIFGPISAYCSKKRKSMKRRSQSSKTTPHSTRTPAALLQDALFAQKPKILSMRPANGNPFICITTKPELNLDPNYRSAANFSIPSRVRPS